MIDPRFLPSNAGNNLSAWRLFLRICDQKSLSRVAQSTGLDVSTISRRINQLESAIGTSLIHRTTRSLVITPAGQKIRGEIEAIIQRLDAVVEQAAEPNNALTDVIHLSAPPCLIEYVISRWALEFAELHRGLRFDLKLSDKRIDPISSGIDVAIHSGAAVTFDSNAVRLGALTSVMAASPTYLKTHGTPKAPEDLLQGHVLLAYAGMMSARATWLQHEGVLRKYRFSPVLQASSTIGLTQAACAGAGILLYGPVFMIGEALDSGKLVEILPEWKQPDTIVHAVVSPESRTRPAVAGFIDFVREKWTSQRGFLASPNISIPGFH